MSRLEARATSAAAAKPGAPSPRASGAKPSLAIGDAGGVSAKQTVRLVRLLESRGLDSVEICRSIGVETADVTTPSARVPYRVADALVEACATALGPGGLSIAIASIIDESTYDAAGLVLLSAATFAEGLTRAFAYQRLWGDGERFTLRRAEPDGPGVVRFRHPGPSALARGVLGELALVETMAGIKMLVNPEARAVAVRFSHQRFDDSPMLAMIFGVEPTFGEADHELVLDAATLDAPMRPPEGMVGAAFDMIARRAIAEIAPSATLRDRARALLSSAPESFEMSVADAAARLKMSPRTLQRRLHAEGTAWGEIVDELRRVRARELASRGANEKEIAFLLGFHDPSALARAKKRWKRETEPDSGTRHR